MMLHFEGLNLIPQPHLPPTDRWQHRQTSKPDNLLQTVMGIAKLHPLRCDSFCVFTQDGLVMVLYRRIIFINWMTWSIVHVSVSESAGIFLYFSPIGLVPFLDLAMFLEIWSWMYMYMPTVMVMREARDVFTKLRLLQANRSTLASNLVGEFWS